MTAEQYPLEPYTNDQPADLLDYRFMSTREAYDYDDEIARYRRRQFYDALPEHMSQETVEELGRAVFEVAFRAETRLSDQQQTERAEAAERRFLHWLGSASMHRDTATAKNVQKALWQGHGLRGKLGAVALKYEELTQY